MKRRRVTYRPSKAQGVFVVVWGGIFVLSGLVVVIPTFGPFGILWTLIAAGGAVMSFYQAFGKLPISFCVPVQLWPLAAQGFSIAGNTISNWDLAKSIWAPKSILRRRGRRWTTPRATLSSGWSSSSPSMTAGSSPKRSMSRSGRRFCGICNDKGMV